MSKFHTGRGDKKGGKKCYNRKKDGNKLTRFNKSGMEVDGVWIISRYYKDFAKLISKKNDAI